MILASGSKFRKRALEILGYDYEVVKSGFDERSVDHSDPYMRCRLIAEGKARAVDSDEVVVAGDLFVLFRGKILEKPKDAKEAYSMLKSLSGEKCSIISSAAVKKQGKITSGAESYTMKFRKIADEEIKDYMEKYDVLDYAGGFDDDFCVLFAESSTGSYPFTTAFPMQTLQRLLVD